MSQIMVVEDDRTLRETLSGLLTDQGYSVRSAANAFEALLLAEAEQPDLVLTDMGLPGMSGIELSRRLHALRSDLPVLAISGSEPDVSAALEVQRFLIKPVELDVLLGAVEYFLPAH